MRFDRAELLAIFAGGCLGTLARAGLADWLPHEPGHWSWATFAANIAGAALLGWAVTRLQERMPPTAYRRPLIGTGVCGALTTFSTLQLELLDLSDAGRAGLALAYLASTLAVGFGALWLASGVARR